MFFNPLNPLFQKIKELFIRNFSKQERRNDEELECLQYGICGVQIESPRSEELFFR